MTTKSSIFNPRDKLKECNPLDANMNTKQESNILWTCTLCKISKPEFSGLFFNDAKCVHCAMKQGIFIFNK